MPQKAFSCLFDDLMGIKKLCKFLIYTVFHHFTVICLFVLALQVGTKPLFLILISI